MWLFNSKEGKRKDADLLIGIYRERSKNTVCLEIGCVQFLCLWSWGAQLYNHTCTQERNCMYLSHNHLLPKVEPRERAPYNNLQLPALQNLLCFSLLHVKGVLLDWCAFITDRKLLPSQSRKKNKAGEEWRVAIETRKVLSSEKSEGEGTWSAQMPGE